MKEINDLVIIDHYKKLDRRGRVEFRAKVLEETGMTQATFYGKITGKNKFTKAERYIINLLLSRDDVTES